MRLITSLSAILVLAGIAGAEAQNPAAPCGNPGAGFGTRRGVDFIEGSGMTQEGLSLEPQQAPYPYRRLPDGTLSGPVPLPRRD